MVLQRARKPIDVRIKDIEAKKAQYQAKIENYKAKIQQLDSQIERLKKVQKQKELENLLKIIKASGKTPEEVIAALK